MERNREARRAASIVGSNGFKRRYRTNSLRDSPDEDGGVELQESVRLRDRVKRDRVREREREKERERERSSRSNKRRRGADIGRDETSEESAEEDEDDEEYMETTATTTAAAVRLLPPAVGSNRHHHLSHSSNNIPGSNHHLQNRKSFPLSSSSKILRASPVWKPGDEIISVSVPRKARSASTKRLHDWISSSGDNNGGGGAAGAEPIPRQESSSPAPAPAAPTSPSSSSRKKLKPSGKLKPPKSSSSSKHNSSNPEELEIEIAEVLYGLMTQSQGPSSKKNDDSDSKKPSNNQIPVPNSIHHLPSVAPKRKKPRQPPENPSSGGLSTHIPAKQETDQMPKSEIPSPTVEKIIPGSTAEKGFETRGNSVYSQPESTGMDSELKPAEEESREIRDSAVVKEEGLSSQKEREIPMVREKEHTNTCKNSTSSIGTASIAATMIKSNSMASEVENQREQKFEIDLMAPPDREDTEEEEDKSEKEGSATGARREKVVVVDEPEERREKDEPGSEPEKVRRFVNATFDLEERVANARAAKNNKSQKQSQKQEPQELTLKAKREEDPLTEKKSGQLKSSLPMPMARWPGGLPPLGYAPLQGVVSMDCSTVTPPPIQPIFSQPRPKRCATHCYIAKNIQSLEQLMKMNPFWQGQRSLTSSNHSGKEKGSQPANNNITSDTSAQRKQQQQILIQQQLPPTNLLGPAFIFPFNQQQATVWPSSVKSPAASGSMASSNPTPSATSTATGMSFNYPANEAQFLGILQNNAYHPFPLPPPNFRGNPSPLFNSPFYSTAQQTFHPSQLQQQNSQPSNNHHAQSIETGGGDDNHPSTTTTTTTDSARGSRPPANIYGRNFAMPMYPPQSFAVLSAAPAVESSNQSEKKPQNSFAISFGPINGSYNNPNPSINLTSTAQNHAAVRSDLADSPVSSSSSVQVNKDHQMMQQLVAICRNNGVRVAEDPNLPYSVITPKFPNGFSQHLAQSSPQWTSSSARTTSPALKSRLQEQNSRAQMQAQISFGGNRKPASQGQPSPPPPISSNRIPSPPMMATSPTTSSISKGAGESPTTSAKTGQGGPSLLAQQQQSRNSPSILGAKPHHQQQVLKNMQQAQFFSNPYSQAQLPNSTGPTSGPGVLCMQSRGPENQRQHVQQGTNDPARAIATNGNVKGGGGLAAASHGITQAAQFTAQLPAGFSYVPIPAASAVQVKAAEQKQPAA